MEHKGFKLEIKEINDQGEFKGLLSTYDFIDDGGDRVTKGAFKNCLGDSGQKKIKLLWQHDTKSPIGTGTISDSPDGLLIDGRLNLLTTPQGYPKVPKAHEAHALLINKDLDELSMGYVTKNFKYSVENGQTVRDLLDVNVMEGSIVTFAMNSQCKISEAKNNYGGEPMNEETKGASGATTLPVADKTVKWDGAAAEKNIFDKYTDDKGNVGAEAKKAFFWVDTSKPNEKASYKLGFADIVDDKLTAIPAGIQAAANAIRGARNPVDIPVEDKKAVAKKINVYLKALKYAEIKDEEIKEDSTVLEHKENTQQLEGKALGFADLLKVQQANEMRWQLQDALNTSFRQLMNDDNMTIEDKLVQLETNVNDFAAAYKEAMKLVLQASTNNNTAKKQIQEVLEIKQIEIETKAGKKISKANTDKIKKAMSSMSDTLTALKEMVDMPEEDDEDTKKSSTNTLLNNQNNTNKQEKSNDVTMELKSEEIAMLEQISGLFKKEA